MNHIKKHININNQGILYEYNTIIKIYANGDKKLKHTTYNVFKGLSLKPKSLSGKGLTPEELEYQRYKNLYQSKQRLIDLAYHNSLINNWEYFVTITFDPKVVDSKDYSQVSKLASKFLDNLKHQNKNLRYILVPELHKSGAVHYHGIFSKVPNFKLKVARNPKNNRIIYKNGCKIYNIINFNYGFTTVSEIKNQEAVSVYIAKYMTKNLIDLNFKKRYWFSRNLERPKIEYALFNKDDLKFYIDKHKVKDVYISNKVNSKSFYYKLIN